MHLLSHAPLEGEFPSDHPVAVAVAVAVAVVVVAVEVEADLEEV